MLDDIMEFLLIFLDVVMTLWLYMKISLSLEMLKNLVEQLLY